MNGKKNLLLAIFSSILTIILIEIIYNTFFRDSTLGSKLDRSAIYSKYSAEELDKTKAVRHKFNGGECVKRGFLTKTKKMNWHPRYGANDNDVNIACINNLFSKKTINVIFYGGSAMFNDEAPNYLTSIDYYAFKDDFENYRSINLANSGARMSNNLASFIEYIPKIENLDHIVFLDGVNEFTGVQLGSDPTYDTYWAQGIEARINKPELIIIEKLITKSIFFEMILKKIFNYQSIRDKSNVKFATKKNIHLAADDYTYRKKITQIICSELYINCHFILQPAIFFDETEMSFSDEIKNYYKKLFQENLYLYSYGYEIIKSQNNDVIDFSKIFNNENDIFIDSVHFNKKGSKILGEKIFEFLQKNSSN
jgi:hypothetical protein